jgi:predicted alpha-1,2-mannosidase
MIRKSAPMQIRFSGAAVVLSLAIALLPVGGSRAGEKPLVRFVDPFIGTANGGNTFPGAVLPWGMVSISPHTNLQAPSGYTHGQPWFYGLGHAHLSGTGCADLGSIIVTAVRGGVDTSPDRYRCTLADEEALPGYWAGRMVEPALRTEATVTFRAGVIRLTPLRPGPVTILLDAGRSLGLVGGGDIRWISETEVEGFNISGGFCGEENRQTIYFAARFTENLAESVRGGGVGGWARFAANGSRAIEIQVGISYVSSANARQNLAAEIGRRTFPQIRKAAADAWEKELSRIRVTGGTEKERTKFYTALYHSLIHPNVISDVSGEYPLFGRSGTGREPSRPRYSVFSLWDTYRTLHPLLTLAYPERQSEIARTMLDMYRESGWLPKWELAGNETNMMVGDGGGAVLAETFLKGIRDYDTAAAYAAMRKPLVTFTPEAEPSRPGYADFVRLGYIPADQDTTRTWWVWGPLSTALEYCYTDRAVARVAAKLGHQEDAAEFERRAESYRNFFDSATGFLRPRNRDGSWLTPFDPLLSEGSGTWVGSGGPGYVEGNAWHYTWFVPHDVSGLARLFGGIDSCAAKLTRCFTDGHFTINNEPDISYPYLFTYFRGHEYKTPQLVHQIKAGDFGTGPSGLPGNDDAGTISAWYVFSALGLYPADPASCEYRFGIPSFAEATISLSPKYYPGSGIRIRGIGLEHWSSAARVSQMRWNGRDLSAPAIDHQTLIRGGTLEFTIAK